MAIGDSPWDLLHDLDDPNHLERPAGFDVGEAIGRFRALQAEIERSFGCDCEVDVWPSVQDASHLGRLTVPASATETGERLVVENPGVYDQAELDVLLGPADRERITSSFANCGYVAVQEEQLWQRYDGASPHLRQHTWWDRFFDYL